MKTLLFAAVLASLPIEAALGFTLEFDWSKLPLCTTGKPKNVTNPTFKLAEVPKGTTHIKFTLTDLDARSYRHGGGTVVWSGEKTIAPGAFKYKSPCPPNGQHRYVWTATAMGGKRGPELGKAKAQQLYPAK